MERGEVTCMQASLLRACVRLLRSKGEYTGDIVIVTNFTSSSELLAPLLMPPYNVTVANIPSVDPEDATRAWWLKSQLLRILDRSYCTIMYVDSDIMVRGPLPELFDSIPRFSEEGSIGGFSEATTRSQPMSGFHAGVMIMQRGVSEPCLLVRCSVLHSTFR